MPRPPLLAFEEGRLLDSMISMYEVERRYGDACVLSFPRWEAQDGEWWLVSGPSGSGKSTLLALLAGLLSVSSGRIVVAGQDVSTLGAKERDRWRGRTIGFLPQRLHLIKGLTVLDNLLLAQSVAGFSGNASAARATLDAVGMLSSASRAPETLSQGQAQRVAIARAVINRPRLIVADEPTSSLDDANAADAVELLMERARACGSTLVVASHDARIANRFEHHLAIPGNGGRKPS